MTPLDVPVDAPPEAREQTADVYLDHVVKRFGDTVAVDDIELDIRHGEFFSLLGPSGCGKTTTLSMIGGFEHPTSGQIMLGGRDVSRVPPYRRDVNTVFQSYALFPHLDVFNNIAFGLRRRRMAKDEVRARVTDALRLVDLPGHETRTPAQLSGGQQQRIALARALVNEPRVLLLDEPLGALDLKLRKQMQLELKRIQKDVGITFLYVTHDQEEAMVMSDRLAVMNKGKIEQLGSPEDVYERPATDFVASFLGASNLIPGTVSGSGGLSGDGGQSGYAVVALDGGETVRVPADRLPDGRTALKIGVRPEKLTIQPAGETAGDVNSITGQVVLASYLGVSHQYTVQGPAGASVTVYVQNQGAGRPPALGETVRLVWSPEHTFVV
ncbi:MAG: ABC transporter ATP-binding protein [Solirubrobacteraceae bacterium]